MTFEEELISKIFGKDPYAWDDYTIMSTEFIDHVGKILKENCVENQRLREAIDKIRKLAYDTFSPQFRDEPVTATLNDLEKELGL